MKSPTSTGEFAEIRKIKETLGSPHSRVQLGIGDDAAILAPSTVPLLFCSDACVEGVHFRLDWTTPEKLGFKSVMACASDIAAMNGEWLYSTISLALPPHLQETDFITQFYQGVARATQMFGADVVGGDLTASPGPLLIDVACVGASRNPIRRSGASDGDLIYVSGPLGSAHAGLELLKSGRDDLKSRHSDLIRAQLEPHARLDLIRNLMNEPELFTSLIDLSDGLSSELHHLAEASQLCFEIDEFLIPTHPALETLAQELPALALGHLHGGEDYQLLATMKPEVVMRLESQQPELLKGWTKIGRVSKGSGVHLTSPNKKTEPLLKKGFRHF